MQVTWQQSRLLGINSILGSKELEERGDEDSIREGQTLKTRYDFFPFLLPFDILLEQHFATIICDQIGTIHKTLPHDIYIPNIVKLVLPSSAPVGNFT